MAVLKEIETLDERKEALLKKVKKKVLLPLKN